MQMQKHQKYHNYKKQKVVATCRTKKFTRPTFESYRATTVSDESYKHHVKLSPFFDRRSRNKIETREISCTSNHVFDEKTYHLLILQMIAHVSVIH